MVYLIIFVIFNIIYFRKYINTDYESVEELKFDKTDYIIYNVVLIFISLGIYFFVIGKYTTKEYKPIEVSIIDNTLYYNKTNLVYIDGILTEIPKSATIKKNENINKPQIENYYFRWDYSPKNTDMFLIPKKHKTSKWKKTKFGCGCSNTTYTIVVNDNIKIIN